MPWLSRSLAIAGWLSTATVAAADPEPAVNVALRPTAIGNAAWDAATVNAYANVIPARVVGRDELMRDGIAALVRAECGRDDPTYRKLVENLNPVDANGAMPGSLRIPPCPRGTTERQEYIVRPGETYGSIKMFNTGIAKDDADVATYFGIAGATLEGKPEPGTKLELPYVTYPTIVTSDQADKIRQMTTASTVRNIPSGHIVSFAAGESNCGTEDMLPFDAAAVAQAFADADKQAEGTRVSTVPVMVVDNGFLGASPDGEADPPRLAFKQPFNEHYFHLTNGQLNPTTIGGKAYPSIPDFTDGSISPEAGHGTHVVGLVLGGVAASDYRDKLFARNLVSPEAWIQVDPRNVGDGSISLLPGADQAILSILGRKEFRIVNLSLSYDDDDRLIVDTKQVDALYVVAAGNDTGLAKDYFPASLGGDNSGTALTVAAMAPERKIASFSNIGPDVDIAAPGCNIRSWISKKDGSLAAEAKSGTSMAAPIVAFQAALLRRLTNWDAAQIRTRIIMSGDVLPEQAWKRGEPGFEVLTVWSKMQINIQKSLEYRHDYIRWIDDKSGETKVAVGTLSKFSNLYCMGSTRAEPMPNIFAYKRVFGSDKPFAFTGVRTKFPAMCDVKVPNGEVRLKSEGEDKEIVVPLHKLLEFVRADTLVRLP